MSGETDLETVPRGTVDEAVADLGNLAGRARGLAEALPVPERRRLMGIASGIDLVSKSLTKEGDSG